MSLAPYSRVFDRIIDLSIQLINLYPAYNRSVAQKEAQRLIKRVLDQEGWQTFIDPYKITDIKNKALLRKPWEYDAYYEECPAMLKHNLYAVMDSGHPGPTLILN